MGALPHCLRQVALRKESVDRNNTCLQYWSSSFSVALRKESVDRNMRNAGCTLVSLVVALRKESVDRNNEMMRKQQRTA